MSTDPEAHEAFKGAPRGELIQAVLDERRRRELEQARADKAVTDADAWRVAKRKDAEAEAIEGCVRALDALKEARGTGADLYGMPRASKFERVLRFLADRYGVPWPTGGTSEQMMALLSEDIRAGERVVVDVASGNAWRAP